MTLAAEKCDVPIRTAESPSRKLAIKLVSKQTYKQSPKPAGSAKQFDSIFEEALWIRYANSVKGLRHNTSLRNQLFEQYADIPKMAAKRYCRTRLPYRSLSDYDDIVADANLGLLKCIKGYDISIGVKFSTFSYTRVNGAIIDGLRVLQDFPRIISKIRRELDPLINRLTQEANRVPSLEEVAARFPFETVCGVDISEVIKDPLIQSNVFSQSLSEGSDDYGEDGDFSQESVIEYCLQRQAKNKKTYSFDSMQRISVIDRMMDCLSDDKEERAVIYYYYFMNMTSSRISKVMGISPSNVCIKKMNALNRIRNMLINDPEFLEELKGTS